MTRIIAANNLSPSCVISCFRHYICENHALLGYYEASSGNFLQTSMDSIWVPSTGCPETSVRNYHYLLRESSEERSCQPHSLAFTKQKFGNTSLFSLRSSFPQHFQNLV